VPASGGRLGEKGHSREHREAGQTAERKHNAVPHAPLAEIPVSLPHWSPP
jgi:hypothetical protein